MVNLRHGIEEGCLGLPIVDLSLLPDLGPEQIVVHFAINVIRQR